jgi:hypothetical protein
MHPPLMVATPRSRCYAGLAASVLYRRAAQVVSNADVGGHGRGLTRDMPVRCLAQSGPVLFRAAATSRNASKSGDWQANRTPLTTAAKLLADRPSGPHLQREADAAGASENLRNPLWRASLHPASGKIEFQTGIKRSNESG